MPPTNEFWIFLRTAVLGAAGGLVAELIGIPSPWLIGPMVAVSVAAVMGMTLRVPALVQAAAYLLIGLSLGNGLSPDTFAKITSWPFTLIAVLAGSVIIQSAGQIFYRRICHWDRASAFYGAVPGVFSVMVALASDTKADIRLVVLAHGMRLFLLVAILPVLIITWEGGMPSLPSGETGTPTELIILLVIGLIAAFAFVKLKVPTAPLLAGMAVSMLMHGTGLSHATLPVWLTQTAFVVMGSIVGGRFVGTDLGLLRRAGIASLGGFVIALALALLFAWLASLFSDIPMPQLILAFAPGGLDTMLSLAYLLRLDSAFVATHQLLRFVFVAATAPILARAAKLDRTEPAPAAEPSKD